jgi:hypothetical protein
MERSEANTDDYSDRSNNKRDIVSEATFEVEKGVLTVSLDSIL